MPTNEFDRSESNGADVWSVLGRLVTWPRRVASARATMRQLAGLDARDLADIGLTIQDLHDAGTVGLIAGPAHLLADRARERREARRPGAAV